MSKRFNIIVNQLPTDLKNPTLLPRIGKIAIRHKSKSEFYKETYVSTPFLPMSNPLARTS